MRIGNCKSSESENEIKHWIDVYNKVYEHFTTCQDYYFKRTQILMFAMQLGLATAFIKLLTTKKTENFLSEYEMFFALFIISLSGIVFCFIWLSMIQRHWNAMEYCRCYMRYIESHLMKLGLRLAILRAESAIFHYGYQVIFGSNEQCKTCKEDPCQEKYPYENKKAKLGL